MQERALNLDDFLSRFQLLRPQATRTALNARQAAVLIPIVRRPEPGLLLTQRSARFCTRHWTPTMPKSCRRRRP